MISSLEDLSPLLPELNHGLKASKELIIFN